MPQVTLGRGYKNLRYSWGALGIFFNVPELDG